MKTKNAGTVTISIDEYDRLRNRSKQLDLIREEMTSSILVYKNTVYYTDEEWYVGSEVDLSDKLRDMLSQYDSLLKEVGSLDPLRKLYDDNQKLRSELFHTKKELENPKKRWW